MNCAATVAKHPNMRLPAQPSERAERETIEDTVASRAASAYGKQSSEIAEKSSFVRDTPPAVS
jgi:hypothetical protein